MKKNKLGKKAKQKKRNKKKGEVRVIKEAQFKYKKIWWA